MNKKQMKLENPVRLEELRPQDTLRRIGLRDNHIICDIGAGSGIFTIPAAMMTNNLVYALDISLEMLDLIQKKILKDSLTNVQLVHVQNGHFDIAQDSVDIALMVTVLHEIDKKAEFLEEVRRILKPGGQLAIIEFHKRETPMGPPMHLRLGESEVEVILKNMDFSVKDFFNLGENYYCLVFTR